MICKFSGIPIPPSMNNSYPTARSGHRYKSKELRNWERQFEIWALQNAKQFQDKPTKQEPLYFKVIFCFTREQLYFKNGKLKKVDLDNRLKHIIDKICQLLEIDDKQIWWISASKRESPHVGCEGLITTAEI